ncbi:MAG: hypothetical protein HYT39_02610 [Candidatus Sungbacteria bacterium]|nr:hypothetical protein [Candidatus Sungbacteria bacterium]
MKNLTAITPIIALFALVNVFTFTTITAAQQAPVVAQEGAPKDAVKASTSETPEKFRPLLGKWKYDDGMNPTIFVVERIDDAGNVDLQYTNRNRNIPMSGTAFLDADYKKLKLKLEGGTESTIKWDLEYSPTFGGMLRGTGELRKVTWEGKFYKVK